MALKLKNITIRGYKNLKDLTMDCSLNTGFISLIGINGSGKSNLLEAVCAVFSSGYTGEKIPFDYEIAYEVDGLEYIRRPKTALMNGKRINKEFMAKPSTLIACYSGEDNRLWKLAFERYYMQYFGQAVRNNTYQPHLIYINKFCWKIAFLSLLCSDKPEVKQFLRDVLHIEDVTDVRVKIVADNKKREAFSNHFACRWYDLLMEKQNEGGGSIDAQVISQIDMSVYGIEDMKKAFAIFQFLYILSMPEKNSKDRQYIDKIITDLDISFSGFSFDDLSEGEKKMILIECISHVLSDENSLVIFDEPDSHVHVDRKGEILERIASIPGQTIFTTHSPVLCNLIQQVDNIKLLQQGKLVGTAKLDQVRNLSGHYINYYDGAFILGSTNILVTEGIYDIRYIKKAISVFSKLDKKYEKLNTVGMLYAGSAGEEDVLFVEFIQPNIDNFRHVVCLFDYDKDGMVGWNKINELSKKDAKIKPIFYQLNFTAEQLPIDKPVPKDTVLVEDLFDPNVYQSKVKHIQSAVTAKDFRCIQNKATSEIKTFIENKYDGFDNVTLSGFVPLLDKLLELFDL